MDCTPRVEEVKRRLGNPAQLGDHQVGLGHVHQLHHQLPGHPGQAAGVEGRGVYGGAVGPEDVGARALAHPVPGIGEDGPRWPPGPGLRQGQHVLGVGGGLHPGRSPPLVARERRHRHRGPAFGGPGGRLRPPRWPRPARSPRTELSGPPPLVTVRRTTPRRGRPAGTGRWRRAARRRSGGPPAPSAAADRRSRLRWRPTAKAARFPPAPTATMVSNTPSPVSTPWSSTRSCGASGSTRRPSTHAARSLTPAILPPPPSGRVGGGGCGIRTHGGSHLTRFSKRAHRPAWQPSDSPGPGLSTPGSGPGLGFRSYRMAAAPASGCGGRVLCDGSL